MEKKRGTKGKKGEREGDMEKRERRGWYRDEIREDEKERDRGKDRKGRRKKIRMGQSSEHDLERNGDRHEALDEKRKVDGNGKAREREQVGGCVGGWVGQAATTLGSRWTCVPR